MRRKLSWGVGEHTNNRALRSRYAATTVGGGRFAPLIRIKVSVIPRPSSVPDVGGEDSVHQTRWTPDDREGGSG